MIGSEVLRSTRRFVLVETDDGYGLIDRSIGDEPIETFPVTDEGFDEAWERFSRLSKEDRLSRGYPWLWMTVAGATALWVVAGIASLAFFLALEGPGVPDLAFRIFTFLSEIGSRIALGGLVLMAALVLRERLARPNEALSPPSRQAPSLGEMVLQWLLVAGLVAWLVGQVGNLLFPPEPFFGGGGFIEVENAPSPVWIAFESLGFSAWVGSFVLLILMFARRWWGGQEDVHSTSDE